MQEMVNRKAGNAKKKGFYGAYKMVGHIMYKQLVE